MTPLQSNRSDPGGRSSSCVLVFVILGIVVAAFVAFVAVHPSGSKLPRISAPAQSSQ